MLFKQSTVLIQALLAGIAISNPVPAGTSAPASRSTSSLTSTKPSSTWSSTWPSSSASSNRTYPCQGNVTGGYYVSYLNTTISYDMANRTLMETGSNVTARAVLPATIINNQDDYLPAIHLASAAYFDKATVTTWSCARDCKTGPTPNLTDITVGGNDPTISIVSGGPSFYVGYNPGAQNITLAGVNGGQGTLVVSFRGTDPNGRDIGANIDSVLGKPSETLFPGSTAQNALVHSGYYANWEPEAQQIISLVQTKMNQHGAKAILVVGHSQGAADAVYMAVALKNKFPSTLISLIGLAMPRTGNSAWADYVDSRGLAIVKHIGNGADPIPVTPPRIGGFSQISGELHIVATNTAVQRRDWYACSGRDSTNPNCSGGVHDDTTAAASLLDCNFHFHNGPYDGVCMGQACPGPRPCFILGIGGSV